MDRKSKQTKTGARKGRRSASEAPPGTIWRNAVGQDAAAKFEVAVQHRYGAALDALVRTEKRLTYFGLKDWDRDVNTVALEDPTWRQRSLTALSRLLIERSENARAARGRRPTAKPRKFSRSNATACAKKLRQVATVLTDERYDLLLWDRSRIVNSVRPWLVTAGLPPKGLSDAQLAGWSRLAISPARMAESLLAMAAEFEKQMRRSPSPGPPMSRETHLAATVCGLIRIATGAPWSLQNGGLLPKSGGRANWKAIGEFVRAALEVDIADETLKDRVRELKERLEMDW